MIQKYLTIQMKKIYNTNAIYTKNEKNIQCTGKRIHCKWKLQKTHKNNTVQMKTYTIQVKVQKIFLKNTIQRKVNRIQMENYRIQKKVIECKWNLIQYK